MRPTYFSTMYNLSYQCAISEEVQSINVQNIQKYLITGIKDKSRHMLGKEHIWKRKPPSEEVWEYYPMYVYTDPK